MPQLLGLSLFNDASLISYWHFNASTSADAKSTNNGTDTNVTYSAANGIFNIGAGFNGSDSKIALPDAANLRPAGAFTLGLWVNFTSVSGPPSFYQDFSLDGAGPRNHYGWLISTNASGFVDFQLGAGGGVEGTGFKTLAGSKAVNDGAWHFICCVYDQTNVITYIDAAVDVSAAWSTNATYQGTQFVRIGDLNQLGGEGNFLNGAIDDVFIFSRALTPAEIKNIYLSSGLLGKRWG